MLNSMLVNVLISHLSEQRYDIKKRSNFMSSVFSYAPSVFISIAYGISVPFKRIPDIDIVYGAFHNLNFCRIVLWVLIIVTIIL